MKTFLKRFLDNRSGATAVEYGLLCALIALAVLGTIGAISTKLEATFTAVANAQPAP